MGRVWKNGQLLPAVGGQQQGLLLAKLLLLQPLISFCLAHLLQCPPSLSAHVSVPCATYCIFCLCIEMELSIGSFSVASALAPSSTSVLMSIFKIYKFFCMCVYIFMMNSLVVKVMSWSRCTSADIWHQIQSGAGKSVVLCWGEMNSCCCIGEKR